MTEKIREQIDRITSYLSNGGLFNPELMEHDKVRDLLIDNRDTMQAMLGVIAVANYLVAEVKDDWDKGRISVDTFHAALSAEKALAKLEDIDDD